MIPIYTPSIAPPPGDGQGQPILEHASHVTSQDAVSHSFLLQILLHPKSQIITVYLLIFGMAALITGILGFSGFGTNTRSTLPSETASKYLIGIGSCSTIIGACSFFASIKYMQNTPASPNALEPVTIDETTVNSLS